MLLFLIILFLLIFIVYIFYHLGLLHVLQIFFLGLLCVLSTIIIYLMLCPTTIKNYLFFQGNFYSLLSGIPSEIIDNCKVNALSEINNPNMGQILSNLTNNIMDVLSQKPIDHSAQLENQTKLLSSIDQKLSDSNTIGEVYLAQYQEGQSAALKKLATIDNSLNTQTKKLAIAINNPTEVLDKLTSINSHVKPNLAILGELHNINYTLGQEKQILSAGFDKMLQAEGNGTLAKEIQSLSNNLTTNLESYQTKTENSLLSMQSEIALERAENKKIIENIQVSSIAEVELAYEEAEKKIQAAENMVNNYRKHESLGEVNNRPNLSTGNSNNNNVNQAAASLGLASALTWALKFLRIV